MAILPLIAVKNGQANRKRRAYGVNGRRVIRVVGRDVELWKLFDDRLPQLLLLRLIAGRKGEQIRSPPCQVAQDALQLCGVDDSHRYSIEQAELYFGR